MHRAHTIPKSWLMVRETGKECSTKGSPSQNPGQANPTNTHAQSTKHSRCYWVIHVPRWHMVQLWRVGWETECGYMGVYTDSIKKQENKEKEKKGNKEA